MRVIARLDIKNEHVIKGINLEGLRKVGDPNEKAKLYYEQGADEIIFIDSVASLYNRNNLFSIIRKAAEEIFVPITIGGGIRTLPDVEKALDSGADKVAINTAAVQNRQLIVDVAKRYGSQCLVASVQAKKIGDIWEAYVETGRERTGLSVNKWVKELEDLGAGEILITSVDQEGTKSGFDIALVEQVSAITTVPIVVSGGCGKLSHIKELVEKVVPSGLCFASVLHYNDYTIDDIKSYLENEL